MNYVTFDQWLKNQNELKKRIDNIQVETTPLIFAKVDLSTAQSLATATVATVEFDEVLTDESSIWSAVDYAFVIPAGYTKMNVMAEVSFSSHATGRRLAVVRKDGASFVGAPSFNVPTAGAGVGTFLTFGGMVEVAEGEAYSIQAFQDSGETLNIEAATTWFSITLYPTGMAGIKGDDGANGTNGVDGAPGADGISAYEAAAAAGYGGTESAFNADLAAIEGLADILAAL